MQIVINLPTSFAAGSNPVENAEKLRAVMDCLITCNLSYLRTHAAPALYQSGVRYGRTLWFEDIPALYERGYGDCKSLSAAMIAQYRMQRIKAEPVFRWRTNPGNGCADYHILVRTIKGFEDPSKALGMGADEVARFMANPITG